MLKPELCPKLFLQLTLMRHIFQFFSKVNSFEFTEEKSGKDAHHSKNEEEFSRRTYILFEITFHLLTKSKIIPLIAT